MFRGPQSGRYGANAHAGLIVLRSNAPTETTEGYLNLKQELDSRRVGAALSGPLAGETLTGRIAVQLNESDGYIDNVFLGQPTGDRDEAALRTRLRWQATDALTADFTYTRGDRRGYDHFSFESNRDALDSRGRTIRTRISSPCACPGTGRAATPR